MKKIKNLLLKGAAGKPMATDIFFEDGGLPKPVVIYMHGFNGFKDWGAFDLIAERFAAAGFVFIKFNGSHNGTTPYAPEEFADLEAYAENNYTKELEDLNAVIHWAASPENPYAAAIDSTRISLVGHSRGGGIVLLQAAGDERIKAVCTWASVAECKTPWGSWTEDKILAWKESDVQYTTNSRTRQEMPLHYQLYEDYTANAERLDIERAVRGLKIPALFCHGTADAAVPVEKALLLKKWSPEAELYLVESDHVFGRKHPWNGHDLPAPMDAVLVKSVDFLREKLMP